MIKFKDFPNSHLIELSKIKIVDFLQANEEKQKIDLLSS